MYAFELCEKYQDAVRRKDLDAVQDLFAPDAIIESLVQGALGVDEFHLRLFRTKTQAIAKLEEVFDGNRELNVTQSIILQFTYT